MNDNKKIIEFGVSVSTGFVVSRKDAILSFEIESDASQDEINNKMREKANEWLLKNIDFQFWLENEINEK